MCAAFLTFLDPRKASKIGVSVNPDAENLGKLKGKYYNGNFPFSLMVSVNFILLFFSFRYQLLYLGILLVFNFGSIFPLCVSTDTGMGG